MPQLHSDAKETRDTQKEAEDSVNSPIDTLPPPRDIRGLKWFVVVSTVLSCTLLFSLDNTIVANIQPSIIEHFGDVSKLPWLGAAFALGATTVLPWGKAFGCFNVKYLYLANVVLFEVGSAICGAAPTLTVLIIGRVIAGVGGCGMYVGCLTYLSVTTTENERPRYISLVILVWGVGTVLGPVVGGALAQSKATWRWAFYINLVIGAIFAPGFLFVLPSINLQKGTSIRLRLEQMDWLGIIIFEAAMTCFIMAINFGGVTFAWSSVREIVLWVMAVLLFIIFALIQRFHPFVSPQKKLFPTQFSHRPLLINLQVQIFLASGVLLVGSSLS